MYLHEVVGLTVVPTLAAEEKRITPQAQRMKDCNAQAHERALAGDARKQFMSECLKGAGPRRAGGSSQGTDGPGEPGAQSEPGPQDKK